MAKIRLKLRKLGETTRSFSYDVNQIPYDYTVEVTNRFKELDLVDRVPEDCTRGDDQKNTKKKKCKKAKWWSEEALQIAVKKKRSKRRRRKGKIYPFECRVPKKSKEREEILLK